MSVFHILLRENRLSFLATLLLTIISGITGIAVLAFINTRLLQPGGGANSIWQFALLVLLFFSLSNFTQIRLSQTGHRFVCTMQQRLVKQIMDTGNEQIRQTGKADILAALSNDIRTLSLSFTLLPELIQGILTVTACSLYLAWLSPALFAVTAAATILMSLIAHIMVKQHYRHFRKMRQTENNLYRHYETTLEGHKELMLNRYRAERFFRQEFSPEADRKRRFHTRADAWHFTALNWGSSIILATIGTVSYLAVYKGWANTADAAVIGMTILFMRSPLTVTLGALPVILQSKVALQSLERLGLSPYRADFHNQAQLPASWKKLYLNNISYTYPRQGGQTFRLPPVNLTFTRGETVFLIGANGSGKSTLLMLLAGLYQPEEGSIYIDNIEITEANRHAYRQQFAAVFTDFHLFEQITDGMGQDVSDGLIAEWLARLQLNGKAKIEAGRILTAKLSQGQRKRLSLLCAALEQRNILILDEWAADQDPEFRRLFYEQLLPILKAGGYTIFAISHDDAYFHHADRILSINSASETGCPSNAVTEILPKRYANRQNSHGKTTSAYKI